MCWGKSDNTRAKTLPTEALAASVVKIAGRDVLATWKVLISLGVAPVLYTLYAALATLVAIRANAPTRWRILTPFLVFVALPFMNYAALKFGEAGMDVLKCVLNLVSNDLIIIYTSQVFEAIDCGSDSWSAKIP